VRDVRELAARAGADVLVGVDGGVTIGNAAEIASWGIDVIVSGSAIFDRIDPAGNLDRLSRQLRTTEEVSDGQR
jgi:ribulose-phosphate 3-epimerase